MVGKLILYTTTSIKSPKANFVRKSPETANYSSWSDATRDLHNFGIKFVFNSS
jgi:hypothetical protein